MGEIVCRGLKCRRSAFQLHIDELRIPEGQKVALLGENGCGKTTLLRALAGLLEYEGSIEYGGLRWDRLPARERARHMSYLPQEADVLFNLTVGELIDLSLGADEVLEEEARSQVLRAVEMEEFQHREFHSMSGGEKRRAMLARILCRRTPFIFLDEPTAPLDMRHASQVMRHIARTNHGIVVALHDLHLAQRYFDRFLLMKHGRILFDKRKNELAAPELEEIYGIRLRDCGDHFVPDDDCPGREPGCHSGAGGS